MHSHAEHTVQSHEGLCTIYKTKIPSITNLYKLNFHALTAFDVHACIHIIIVSVITVMQ